MAVDTLNHDGIIGSAAVKIITAESLTGEKIVNESGDVLGTVQHVMLDIHEGRIAYLVLSFGGFLGLGEKLFAIPWHSFALDVDNKWLVLNVPKEKLQNAPGFDKDKWPSMGDPAWTQQVHGYFGPVAVGRRPFI
jgi:sporulation protein YlmC with PRC-barrel domain